MTDVIFDIDGTLLDTENAVLNSLRDTIMELKNESVELTDIKFVLGIPAETALAQLGITDTEAANRIWNRYMGKYYHTIKLFEGVEDVIKELKALGYKLGIVTSKNRDEYANDFAPFGLDRYFDTVICVEDSERPKPAPDPILKYLEVAGIKNTDAIYIGDTIYDMHCAAGAGVGFGLALWGCHSVEDIHAAYYFNSPGDILYTLAIRRRAQAEAQWIKLAKELQFLAQGGLTYTKDIFDKERFERIRDISAEMISLGSGYETEQVKSVFCNETGFQTPKLDTRAVLFREGKILLVEEKNGLWSLPGGWVDVNDSIKTSVVKEAKEEAGLDIVPLRIIAVQDRNRHNTPLYAYGVIKFFVLCEQVDGSFSPNIETVGSGYFGLDELPPLAEDKTSAEQVKLCFDAYYSGNWNPVFD